MNGLVAESGVVTRPLTLLPVRDDVPDYPSVPDVADAGMGWLDGVPMVPMKSGRECIKYVCEMLGLTRRDEIWITTTSETAFVSSCVTSSAFNFSAVSRVFSERTRLILAVHEFGFPHPGISELAAFARARSIPLLEDCAYSFLSKRDGCRIGTFGDFALYSLPKVFPVSGGGLLVGCSPCITNRFYDERASAEVVADLRLNIGKIERASMVRREVFRQWEKSLTTFPLIYPLGDSVPSVFGFKHKNYRQIHQSLESPIGEVEFARTYNEDWVLVPSHQFVELGQIKSVSAKIQQIAEGGLE